MLNCVWLIFIRNLKLNAELKILEFRTLKHWSEARIFFQLLIAQYSDRVGWKMSILTTNFVFSFLKTTLNDIVLGNCNAKVGQICFRKKLKFKTWSKWHNKTNRFWFEVFSYASFVLESKHSFSETRSLLGSHFLNKTMHWVLQH